MTASNPAFGIEESQKRTLAALPSAWRGWPSRMV